MSYNNFFKRSMNQGQSQDRTNQRPIQNARNINANHPERAGSLPHDIIEQLNSAYNTPGNYDAISQIRVQNTQNVESVRNAQNNEQTERDAEQNIRP